MDSFLKMKILDSNLKYFGINMAEIMENAGKAVADEVSKCGKKKRIAVFCGLGNNGGDGFVAARHLAARNKVHVFLLGKKENIRTIESKVNFSLLQKVPKVKITEIASKNAVSKIKLKNFDVAVDAMLGAGASGKLLEPYASAVALLNKSKIKKVAVDVPTPGLKADLTVSFSVPKAKNAKVVDIGIPKEFWNYAGPAHVKFLKSRKKDSHKGGNGIVLIVAGSKQYHGAAIFSGIAASRLVDLVLFATPSENIPYVKKASPEFIVYKIDEAKRLLKKADSVLIGPGLENSAKIKKLVDSLLKETKKMNKKVVLDATALRILDKKLLHENCVLTPHKNEFETLFKINPAALTVREMAEKYDCIILLKAQVDLISDGKEIYRNFSGNEGMTAGGTGDVLAGLLAGFAAKNELLHSALAAAFLNGFAGDLLKKEKGLMYNASDLLEKLPEVKLLCENY